MIGFAPAIGRAIVGSIMTASALAPATLPEGEGSRLTMRVCGGCHGIEVATSYRLTKAGWSRVVDKMALDGANATDEEFDLIVAYLAKNFGKTPSAGLSPAAVPAKLNVNKASPVQLEKHLALSRQEAAAIVRYRDEHGGYKNLRDLKKVPGLNVNKIEANKDRLVF
jgi:competence ComEA-like helix-hairpin-helix protein